MYSIESFKKKVDMLHIELSDKQYNQYVTYYEMVVAKNKVMNLKITLLDSLNKRINFLNEVVETLGLENVETCHGRAEDFGHRKEYREQYDLCTSRAVANLSTLSEYCVPFVKIGGQFVSYKSGNVDNELRESEKAIRILGGEIGKVCSFVLPETDFARTLVPIKKIKSTGKKYPRKAGTPSKEPLQ